jgi:Na+-exporting ATPase
VVPADVRLLESANLETDEALLTGESLPVAKDAAAVYPRGENIGVGDRLNMAFASSTITKGRARGIVAATGMHTEIGAIAASLQGGGETRLRRLRSGSEAPRKRARFERFISAAAHTTASKIGHFLGVNVGTPLQRRLSQLAVGLFGLAVVFAVVVEAANMFSSRKEVIIYAVSTGLSMIPASLVVVLTITLAIGTKRMVQRNVIVRKLDSLEALGAVTDVCSDKTGTCCVYEALPAADRIFPTGTLTQGRMVTRKAWLPALGTYSLGDTSDPFNPHDGTVSFSKVTPADSAVPGGDKDVGKLVNLTEAPGNELEAVLHCAALCNLAHVFEEPHGQSKGDEKNAGEGGWAATGDPTEMYVLFFELAATRSNDAVPFHSALQVFAHRFGRGRTTLVSRGHELLTEFPFSSDVKRMSVLFASPSGSKPARMAYMKGAVERVLDACGSIRLAGGPTPLDEELRENVMRNVDMMAEQGLRVLALASREWEGGVEGIEREEVERNMSLLGLMGIYDPPSEYPSFLFTTLL